MNRWERNSEFYVKVLSHFTPIGDGASEENIDDVV